MPEVLSWLMIATHVPPDGSGGGMSRYAVELCRALSARGDIDLTVLVERATAEFMRDEVELPAERVAVVPWHGAIANSVAERSGIGVPALRRGYDVVHGTKHLLPWRTAGTTLLTIHDMILLDRPRDFPLLKRRLLKRPYLASIAEADVLVAVSEASRRRTEAYVPGAGARTAVVPLAVAPTLLDARSTPVPELPVEHTALVVSDFSPRKNLAFVLDCWAEVRQRRPGATLALVGAPPRPGTEAARQLDAARRRGGVVHLNAPSDAQLRWLYEHVRVTLCPSEMEGFGLPAREAVTFGCPVLASTDPALQEASAGAARALPPRDRAAWIDAIVDAIDRPRRPRPVGDRPRTWADVAAETEAAVRGTLLRRPQRSAPVHLRPSLAQAASHKLRHVGRRRPAAARGRPSWRGL